MEPCPDCGCDDYDPHYKPVCPCWDVDNLREAVEVLSRRGASVCGALFVALEHLEQSTECSWQYHRNIMNNFVEEAKKWKFGK